MHKIQIDNFIFHVNVKEYSPAIPGSYNKNAASDVEYFGCPETFDWECFKVFELCDCQYCKEPLTEVTETNKTNIVDLFAEQITEQLLDKLEFEQECAEECYV